MGPTTMSSKLPCMPCIRTLNKLSGDKNVSLARLAINKYKKG